MFKIGNQYKPAFVTLMMRKAKKAYLPTFLCIYDELAPKFNGSEVHQDSEVASHKATKEVMMKITRKDPSRDLSKCKVKMCFFHHTSNIIANLKNHGLIKKYYKSPAFRQWARKLMLLCFLPADNIATTYETYFKPTTFPWYNDKEKWKSSRNIMNTSG